MDSLSVAALRKLRTTSPKLDGPIFLDDEGRPLDPSRVSRRFRKLVARSGLPKIRLHDLRHTHATLALQEGVHPKIASERLGHATVSLTLDVYRSHASRSRWRQIAALVFD
jgi:integrase